MSSAHILFGRLLSKSIALTLSISIRLTLSALPFCKGIYGTDGSHFMPDSVRSSYIAKLVYLPPSSVQNHLIRYPESFSTMAFHLQKLDRIWLFSLIR